MTFRSIQFLVAAIGLLASSSLRAHSELTKALDDGMVVWGCLIDNNRYAVRITEEQQSGHLAAMSETNSIEKALKMAGRLYDARTQEKAAPPEPDWSSLEEWLKRGHSFHIHKGGDLVFVELKVLASSVIVGSGLIFEDAMNDALRKIDREISVPIRFLDRDNGMN